MSTVRVHTAGIAPPSTSRVRVHTATITGAIAASRVRVHTATIAGVSRYNRWDPVSKTWKATTWQALGRTIVPPPVGPPPVAPWVFDPTVQPDTTNTGVPAGTVLTANRPANGQLVVSAAGTTLDGLDIFGQVYVQAANVTIRNCRIRGRAATGNEGLIQATSSSVSNLLIENCTLLPDTPSYWLTGIIGHDYTARTCNISRTVDGFGAYNTSAPGQPLRVTVESNYVHDLSFYSPDPNHAGTDNMTHNDCFQIQGGTGAVVRGNRFDAYYATDVGSGTKPRPQALSCMLFNNNVGNTGNHVIEDNWFFGGYVPINGIGTPGVDLGRMWRNKFNGDTVGSPPQTIQLYSSTTLLDVGAGTDNKNVFTNSATDILVRYSH